MTDQTCIHCSQPLSKHFRIERMNDLRSNESDYVLICPVCTFGSPGEKAAPNEQLSQVGINV